METRTVKYDHDSDTHHGRGRAAAPLLRPAQLARLQDAAAPRTSLPDTGYRLAPRVPVGRRWAHVLIYLAAISWVPVAHAQRVGTTPAQIQQYFAGTFRTHMIARRTAGGSAEVYRFLDSLSSFQLYEMCHLYQIAPNGGSCYVFLGNLLGVANHAALSRLMTVNLMYNQAIYSTSVPGGRKAVQKIATIGGFPANATLYEVYLEYATMPGYTAAEAIGAAVYDFSGPIAWYAGTGYAIGTGISWFIQTFEPSWQVAIGDALGPVVDGAITTVTLEIQVINDISAIEIMGAPGLNEIDFDGVQLYDPSLGALATGQGGL